MGDNDLVTRQRRIALDLGQAGELKEGAIPPDLLLEIINSGASRDTQVFDLGYLSEISERLRVQGGAQDGVVRAASIDPGFGRGGKSWRRLPDRAGNR